MTKHVVSTAVSTLALAGVAFLASCAPSPGRRNVPHQQFDTLDLNKDGRINYEEFQKSKMARKSSDPRNRFALIDANGDRSISLTEWHECHKHHKKN